MKVLPFFALCGVVALASATMVSAPNARSSVCDFQPVTEFNPKLPASHILNQCARYQEGVEEVSWLSWVAGKSSSFQFHFLDLLELLHSDNSHQDFSSSPKDAQ
ncbi:hypothetical protein [Alteromonas sp. P256]|uniref:hypothetical protein n=1 Tax=Alteromonas sp. P256 TaxID=3117399 RepID=UPI002FE070DD